MNIKLKSFIWLKGFSQIIYLIYLFSKWKGENFDFLFSLCIIFLKGSIPFLSYTTKEQKEIEDLLIHVPLFCLLHNYKYSCCLIFWLSNLVIMFVNEKKIIFTKIFEIKMSWQRNYIK